MLNRQEKNLMFINSMISIALAMVIVIPWSTTQVLNAEVVVKVWVCPIVALVLFLINLGSKYRNYRPAVRFTTVSAYFPIFSVFASLLSFALLVLVRSNLPYGANAYVFMLAFTAVVLVAVLVLSHLFYRAVIVFTKNEMMLVDAPIALLFLGAMFFVNSVCHKYIDLGEPLLNTSSLYIIVPAVLGALVSALLVVILVGLYKGDEEYTVESKKALLEEFMAMHKREYDKAELHILQNLFKYSKGQLGLSVAASGIVEKLKAEKAELEAKIKELENAEKSEAIDKEKLLDLQKRLADLQVVLGDVQVQQGEEREKLEQERAELNNEKAKLAEEIENLKSENTKLEDEHIAFETEKMNYVAPVVVSEEEVKQIEELKAEVEKLQGELETANNELALLKEKLEETAGISKSELEAKEAEIAKLQEELASKEKELEALKAEHESKHEELEELRSTHQEELEKLEAEIKENDDELEKYKAEEAARLAEEERKAQEREEALKNKKAKKFKPSYEKIVNFASSLPEKEIRVVSNANGNQSKYYLGKKLFLVTLSTNNDYRITFCSDQEKAYPLIVNNPGIVVKATSPKGPEWFKITNKGELDEKLLKNIIKNSAQFVVDQEEAKVRAIEEEKARKIAEKEAEKAAAKAEKEAERAAEKAAKEAERAAKEAQKMAELEAQRKAKEEEEKAKREAQEEKDRIAAEKAKAKEEAEKAKEKERLAKEKEKAKEKERLAKEKEKAKEKERLAKEKEKAKEKERLAKEKAKEKERLAKEKEKAKAKEAAEKAKEKERLAKEKAKEEEKARKAAEKAAEKEARKNQEAKIKEEAKKIEEAERAAQEEAETKKAA